MERQPGAHGKTAFGPPPSLQFSAEDCYAFPHAQQATPGTAGIRAPAEAPPHRLLNEMLARDTGQSMDRLASDTERDFIMSAEEARVYGIIDEVITTRIPAEPALGAA